MYASVLTRKPRYSMPHLSLTATFFPVSDARKGFGLMGAPLIVDDGVGWTNPRWIVRVSREAVHALRRRRDAREGGLRSARRDAVKTRAGVYYVVMTTLTTYR